MISCYYNFHEIIFIAFRTDVSKLRRSNTVYTFVLYRYELQFLVLCTEVFIDGC